MEYVKKLESEASDLYSKICALKIFLESGPDPNSLKCPERLLRAQLEAMERYYSILEERIRIEE